MKEKVTYEKERSEYLKDFQRENLVDEWFSDDTKEVGQSLVNLLKKEGLTYDDAYASLQYAYNLIKFESNFLKLS